MGNNICCQDIRHSKETDELSIIKHQDNQKDQHKEYSEKFESRIAIPQQQQQNIEIPELASPIQKHLQKQRPLYDMLSKETPTTIRYGNDVYEGIIDEKGRPKDYGKMYHKSGAIFIGRFEDGIAKGQGHYVRPDGSYYHGNFDNNMANDSKGCYWAPQFQYRGGFVDNMFEGFASQKSSNYEFEGTYKNGNKVQGILTWKQNNKEYRYEGTLNPEGKPHGLGKLFQPSGQYEGQFVNGQKHGKGEFKFISGLIYKGDYRHNIKEGEGKIINYDGVITYQGQFKNGLPHGMGRIFQNGNAIQTQWKEGIDTLLL